MSLPYWNEAHRLYNEKYYGAPIPDPPKPMTLKCCRCGTEIQPEQDECEECAQYDDCDCGRAKYKGDACCTVCEDTADERNYRERPL